MFQRKFLSFLFYLLSKKTFKLAFVFPRKKDFMKWLFCAKNWKMDLKQKRNNAIFITIVQLKSFWILLKMELIVLVLSRTFISLFPSCIKLNFPPDRIGNCFHLKAISASMQVKNPFLLAIFLINLHLLFEHIERLLF